MFDTVFGIKLGQTQVFSEEGTRIPVTKIQVKQCWVTQVIDNEEYKAVQVAFGERRTIAKAQTEILKKAGLKIKPRFFREIRVSEIPEGIEVGQLVSLSDVFEVNDKVYVSAVSKGKGYAGVVKRHGFRGGPKTHGQSDRERAPGSIGAGTTPGRVYKGKRMGGRMGGNTVKQLGLRIIDIDTEANVVSVTGTIPGPRNTVVRVGKQSR